MPGKPKRAKQTEKGKELRGKLYSQILHAFKMEGVNPNIIADALHTSLNTIYGIRKNRDMTTYNLCRIIDLMGYEIVMRKIPGKPPMCDDPEIISIIKRFNEKQLYAKRKARNQPTTGPLPAKVRVKIKRSGNYSVIISRRQLEQESRHRDAFSSGFGEQHEISHEPPADGDQKSE